MTAVAIERIETSGRAHELNEGLAEVLHDCVAGGASVSFMWPFGIDEARAFWRRVAAGIDAGQVVLWAALGPSGEVLGTVQLGLDGPCNQRHRGDVRKMLVRASARRRGVGEALLQALEAFSRAQGMTLLTLDTATG